MTVLPKQMVAFETSCPSAEARGFDLDQADIGSRGKAPQLRPNPELP